MAEIKAKKQVKKEVKTAKAAEVKTVSAKKVAANDTAVKSTGLTVPVYGLTGTKKGTVSLPKEIFGVKVNTALLTQAIRVYLVNQRQGNASTQSRGDVTGSTRKIYRQKGTGRARHGAIKAPIFVGGGVALGPRPRFFELKFSKQMKRKALISALSSKAAEGRIFVADVDGATGKTKEIYGMLKSMDVAAKKKVLFVSDAKSIAVRAARNINGVSVEPVQNLNTFEVMNSNSLIFAKGSIEALSQFFAGKE